jgi:hypothetical protein
MYINIYLLFKQLLLKESALMTGLMVLMVEYVQSNWNLIAHEIYRWQQSNAISHTLILNKT